MKKYLRFELVLFSLISIIALVASCMETKKKSNEVAINEVDLIEKEQKTPAKPLNKEFKEYWYAGLAEINSYSLKQARYGEIREGQAVLVFVTEPFLPKIQVKADKSNSENISVLKLNSTKKYLTGIYPYSIMTSTFYPVENNAHALKVSASIQEWCGHVYTQLNNRDDFEINSHSYFQGEADKSFKIDKDLLENELWNKIRINPESLPLGEVSLIPSLEYIRMTHIPMKSYSANLSLEKGDKTSTYVISYKNPERTLRISFSSNFPYEITGWTDTFKSGFGSNAKTLTSTATKINTIKSPYWRQNSNADVSLRDSLGL